MVSKKRKTHTGEESEEKKPGENLDPLLTPECGFLQSPLAGKKKKKKKREGTKRRMQRRKKKDPPPLTTGK